MKTISWFRLLVIGALVAPIPLSAQAPIQPKVWQVAQISGADWETAVWMPNRKVLILGAGDSIAAYDLATKRTTLIARGWERAQIISPKGDRVAWERRSEDRNQHFVWTIPVDPKTGAATGPAQRVTTFPSRAPSFSPDGKVLAMGANQKSLNDYSSDLVLVPANGGPERLLASYPDKLIVGTTWSADGKWILVDFYKAANRVTRSLERVPAAGGRSELLVEVSDSVHYAGEGQFNGTIYFWRANSLSRSMGEITYRLPSGARGEFKVPPMSEPGAALEASLLARTTRGTTAHILDVGTGKVREVLPGASMSRDAAWSPDGSKLAVQDSAAGRAEITIMNGDGTQPRRYPVVVGGQRLRWSPNSQLMTYWIDPRTLMLLDAESGKSHSLYSLPKESPSHARELFWRADSRAVVLVTQAPGGQCDIVEVGIDGTRRPLISPVDSGYVTGGFLSDRAILINSTSRPITHVVVPLTGGRGQQLPASNRLPWFGVSKDGDQLLFLLRNNDGNVNSLEVMNSRSYASRTINVPFDVDRRNVYPPFTLDGQGAIVVGKKPGETNSHIFMVPFDGAAPRVLATLPAELLSVGGLVTSSPDGKWVGFTTLSSPTTTFYDIDLNRFLVGGRNRLAARTR